MTHVLYTLDLVTAATMLKMDMTTWINQCMLLGQCDIAGQISVTALPFQMVPQCVCPVTMPHYITALLHPC